MKCKYFLIINLVLFLAIGCSTQTPQSSNRNTSDSAPSNLPTEEASPSTSRNDNEPTPDLPPETSKTDFFGAFVALDHPTVGEAKIVTEGDRQYLELSEDFKTDAGPDLVVVLHRSPQIQTSALNEGDYFALAPLKEIRGSQRYALPESLDRNYGSVAIWCRQFNVTFGYAKLQ